MHKFVRILGHAIPCMLLLGCGHERSQSAFPGSDPHFAVVLEDVVRVPFTRPEPPRARINWLVAAPDSSARQFVNDMSGQIYVLRDGQMQAVPFLDMGALRPDFVSEELFEHGLHTFAFHPDFARSDQPGAGKLYTFSTERTGKTPPTFAQRPSTIRPAHDDVILEWRVAPGGDRVDSASAREVMRISHPLHDHVGGQVAFNPNAKPGSTDYGLLYVSVGDGGNTVFRNNQVDEWRTAQDRSTPLGKILRINPLASGERSYEIPADNPFINEHASLPEIWAYGLRNPQRFSWDRGGAHAMIIADVGQALLEELDIGVPGANYGWSEREGVFTVNHGDQMERFALPLFDAIFGYTYPALVYGHHLGRAITGGFVYRGTALPALQGFYLFGDTASGRIFCVEAAKLKNGEQAAFFELPLVYKGKPSTLLEVVQADRADLRISEGAGGEPYVLTKQDGMVRRLAGTVTTTLSIVSIEYPVDPFDESSGLRGLIPRLKATARDLLRRI